MTIGHREVEKEKIEEEISEGWVAALTLGTGVLFWTSDWGRLDALTSGEGIVFGGEVTSETSGVSQPLTSSDKRVTPLFTFAHGKVAFKFTSQKVFPFLEQFWSKLHDWKYLLMLHKMLENFH